MIDRPNPSRFLRRHPARGQAAIELALVAPVLVAFVFVIISFWLYYQKTATYTSAAQTLTEWIARDGQYTTSMGTSIQGMLNDAVGVDTADTYLTIVIFDPVTNETTTYGEAVPATVGDPPTDTGWNDAISNVVSGDFVQVDIWSYHIVGASSLHVGFSLVPDGHAAMRSMWIETSP